MKTRPRKPSTHSLHLVDDDSQLVLKQFTTLCVGTTSVQLGPPGSSQSVTYRVCAVAGGRPVELLSRLLPSGRSHACWSVEESSNRPYHCLLDTFGAHQV